MTQLGRWKEYPKTSKSRREIPVPGHVLELLTPLAVDKSPGELLFHTERPYHGELRPWSGANWRGRWYAAIEAAREKGVPVPLYPPHALRHTAASLLVQQGVPLYDVQRLLGHESFQITQRYSHLAPDTFSAIEGVWQRLLTHQERIEAPADDEPTA
jgi:integrase